MSFQYVIDSAESISINRMKVVAATNSRDGTVRAVSRGGQVWQFDVKLPDGLPWLDWRGKISELELLDRVTTAQIKFSNSNHNWLCRYQGNSVNFIGFTASWTQGATSITLTSSPTTVSGFKFRAGDFIQLGSGKVYTVAADVAFNSNTVNLHRPILDSSGSGSLNVGPNATWTVICSQFPRWTISQRNIITWNGSFIFTEALA